VNASKGTQQKMKWLISLLPLAKQTRSRMSDEEKKKRKTTSNVQTTKEVQIEIAHLPGQLLRSLQQRRR
jgi:hypothetical protein